MSSKKRPNLAKIANKWRKRLGLHNWSVAISYQRRCYMDEKAGRVNFVRSNMCATIDIIDPVDWPIGPHEEDTEQTVVHELLHLVWDAVTPDSDGETHIQFEQAINLTAAALVNADRRRKS